MKIKLQLQKAAITASTLLFGVMMTATPILWANEDTISSALGQTNAVVETTGDKKYTADELEYYKSSFKSIKEVVMNGFKVQEEEQKEGTVLLKNDNSALPLTKGAKVSVFGVSGAAPFYGASGSGGINTSEAISWYEAFRGLAHTNADAPKEKVQGEVLLNINEKLATDYTTWAAKGSEYAPASSVSSVKIGDAPWNVVQTGEGYADVEEYGDAAIYIIKRTGGEGYDLPATSGKNEQYGNQNNQYVSENDGTYGDYLQLSPSEISVLNGLKELKAQNKIKKIVLVLNMASTIQLDFLQKNSYGIDACLWTGSVGEVGTVAVAKLLTGVYNFSGGASTTLWSDNLMNPVNNNFMDQNYFFTYPNYAEFNMQNPALDSQYQSSFTTYTVYQEGMYLGYKYTETRYEDYVTGAANVGNYDYSKVVAYPFGYGISYTDFTFSNMQVSKSGKTYTVKVDVTNNGDTAGKTPVQIYVSKPYGSYAKQNNIQVPSVELIEFGKTPELAAKATTTVSIDVNEKYFASYDTFGAETYVTMSGDYHLIAARNAHEAVNNLLAAKGHTPDNTDGRMDAEGNSDLVKSFSYRFDDKTFAFTENSGFPITNQFGFADINTYEGKGNNSVKYYDRSDWNGTVKLAERKQDGTLVKHNATLTMTKAMADDMRNQMDAGYVIKPDETKYPVYGADNGLKLIDLIEVGYESSLWDKLLDQMSWDETVELLSNGRHKTIFVQSVTKPSTGDENGPNGFNQTYKKKNEAGSRYSGPTNPLADRAGGFDEDGNYIPDRDIDNKYTSTGFSSNGVLAATFNKEIAEKVGAQIGEEGLWAGQAGLLGIGLNIIRTPYAGRTAEYVSEDAILSGLISAPEIKAIESKGVHCFIKHAAMNECETARHGVNTWATEQSMREIYLRAFEIGITEGESFSVMTSFSRMGTQAVANCVPFAKWLRNECKLPGIIETDCAGDMTDGAHGEAYVSRIVNVYTGATDLNEYNYGVGTPDYTGSTYKYDYFKPGNSNGNFGKLAQAMRESAKRILYHTVTSNAMNSYSSNTKITRVTPPWKTAVIVVDALSGILLVASVGWFAVTSVMNLIAKRKDNT